VPSFAVCNNSGRVICQLSQPSATLLSTVPSQTSFAECQRVSSRLGDGNQPSARRSVERRSDPRCSRSQNAPLPSLDAPLLERLFLTPATSSLHSRILIFAARLHRHTIPASPPAATVDSGGGLRLEFRTMSLSLASVQQGFGSNDSGHPSHSGRCSRTFSNRYIILACLNEAPFSLVIIMVWFPWVQLQPEGCVWVAPTKQRGWLSVLVGKNDLSSSNASESSKRSAECAVLRQLEFW
jgi:hypothetical protein